MVAFDYSKLGEPFGGDLPAGINLRADKARIAAYHAVRDARSAARADDRSSENPYVVEGDNRSAGNSVNQPSDKWQEVHDLSYKALETETKDVELFCWLAEAAVRLYGVGVLADILCALRSLIESHLDALHGPDDETPADKVSSLSGLNGSQDSDGTLIRPLRLTSLAPNQIYGRFSLWDYDQSRKAKDSGALAAFQQEFANANGKSFASLREAVAMSLQHITAIDKTLTAACGADAPSVGRIRDVLEDMASAYKELSVHVNLPQQPVPAASVAAAEGAPSGARANGAHPPHAPAAVSGPIADREHAFRQMLEVAAFFRRTEPHSTLPLAIETLVRRGRMDFIGLLAELVPDENQRREMLTRAGIEPGLTKDIKDTK